MHLQLDPRKGQYVVSGTLVRPLHLVAGIGCTAPSTSYLRNTRPGPRHRFYSTIAAFRCYFERSGGEACYTPPLTIGYIHVDPSLLLSASFAEVQYQLTAMVAQLPLRYSSPVFSDNAWIGVRLNNTPLPRKPQQGSLILILHRWPC